MRCVALLSGGLDSKLAIRLMQEQGIEVEALNFKTLFTCCQDQAALIQFVHDQRLGQPGNAFACQGHGFQQE